MVKRRLAIAPIMLFTAAATVRGEPAEELLYRWIGNRMSAESNLIVRWPVWLLAAMLACIVLAWAWGRLHRHRLGEPADIPRRLRPGRALSLAGVVVVLLLPIVIPRRPVRWGRLDVIVPPECGPCRSYMLGIADRKSEIAVPDSHPWQAVSRLVNTGGENVRVPLTSPTVAAAAALESICLIGTYRPAGIEPPVTGSEVRLEGATPEADVTCLRLDGVLRLFLRDTGQWREYRPEESNPFEPIFPVSVVPELVDQLLPAETQALAIVVEPDDAPRVYLWPLPVRSVLPEIRRVVLTSEAPDEPFVTADLHGSVSAATLELRGAWQAATPEAVDEDARAEILLGDGDAAHPVLTIWHHRVEDMTAEQVTAEIRWRRRTVVTAYLSVTASVAVPVELLTPPGQLHWRLRHRGSAAITFHVDTLTLTCEVHRATDD